MTKLSQHGGFDDNLLLQIKDSLIEEFTEGEYDSFEFAQLCQRGDSSVYGIAGGKKCRKGSPISVKPGEGMPDLARKAKKRGLKQKDVKSVADAVRDKYGAKVVKKGAPLESAARRLGERLKPEEQKPQDRPKRMAVNKKFLVQARTPELMRVLKEESLNNYQRKRLEDELRNRGMSSSAIPKPAGKAARPAQRGEKAGFETPQGIKGYDPKKDMAGSGKLIGQGAMGRVKLTDGPPPGVTKEGKIGEFEAAALKRLEDTGITPRLHGVVVEGQAKRVSGGLGGHVKEASGYLGMSRVAGKPYGDQRWKMTQEQKEKAVDEYLKVRKEIHTRGVAHNDMHGGNFFYNAQTGKGGLVDFGLAQVSPKAALVEALGTTNGQDWQADRMDVGGYNTPAVKRLVSNAAKVRDRMRREHRVQINMGIRSPMDQINTAFGKMTDKDAETYLAQLYEEI
jgi:hypothetical protein